MIARLHAYVVLELDTYIIYIELTYTLKKIHYILLQFYTFYYLTEFTNFYASHNQLARK